MLAYHSPDLFQVSELRFLQQIQENLEIIPGIKSCISLVNVQSFWNEVVGGEIITNTAPFLKELPTNSEELSALKKKALANPLYLKNFISKDGRVAGFNIIFDDGITDLQKEETVKKIISTHKSFNRPSQFYLAGMHVFMESTGRYIENDIILYTSLLVLIMFVLMLIIYRNIWASLMILSTVAISNILTIGTVTLLGMKISIATTATPAIITAFSIAYTIHIFSSSNQGMNEVLLSNFLAILTTLLGFASMLFSPMPTVNQLGLYLVMGSIYCQLTILLFATPMKLRYFSHLQRNELAIAFTQMCHKFVKTKRLLIYLYALLMFIISFFVLNMKLDTNYYKYFKERSEIVKSVDFINQHLSGQYPIVVKITNPSGVKNEKTLRLIEKYSNFISTSPDVDKVINYLSLLNEGEKAFSDEIKSNWYLDLRALEEVHMLLEGEDKEMLRYYINSSEDSTLIFVRTKSISSLDFKSIVAQTRQFFAQEQLDNLEISIGGTYLNTVESADKMSASQLTSSFYAISAILLIIFIFARKFSLMLFAGVVNILPIFAIYGIMGIMQEPLNMGTAIIASIAFGMGVDDTIHFIIRYRYAFKKIGSVEQAISLVFFEGVPSMTYTSIVIGIGFLSLALSSFTPIYQLGVYTSLTMLLCYTFDVFVLPRLLYDFEKDETENVH
ncbi:MAG: hypothetical protein A2451_01110 [Bdellovibrionales bacterium RIFOXYC2_FULL_39_8]|nr:MAG: hypothetical protein A2451_01110 [Bdellovibrionales bacterium RIFOXYC2_FULL_39_8]